MLLTPVDDGFQLIAGERRLRASVIAGKHTIPAVVRTADEQSQLALALVENLQRADLNALDEARAFRQLMDEFGLTQEQVAQRIGRSRAAIANTLRLLSVAQAIQDAVRAGRISEGHARALAGLTDHEQQQRTLELVERKGLSVRQTEQLVKDQLAARAAPLPVTAPGDGRPRPGAYDRAPSGGPRHPRHPCPGKQGGRIIITWFEADDLMRLCERLAGGDR